MRQVFEAKPEYRYNPRCPRCGETGSSKPVWQNESGGGGVGSEYVKLVAPRCPRCGIELTRTADAPKPPPPPPEPAKSSFPQRIPPLVWVIGGVVLLLMFLSGR